MPSLCSLHFWKETHLTLTLCSLQFWKDTAVRHRLTVDILMAHQHEFRNETVPGFSFTVEAIHGPNPNSMKSSTLGAPQHAGHNSMWCTVSMFMCRVFV